MLTCAAGLPELDVDEELELELEIFLTDSLMVRRAHGKARLELQHCACRAALARGLRIASGGRSKKKVRTSANFAC